MVISIVQEKEPSLAPLTYRNSLSVGPSAADQTRSSYPIAEHITITPVTEPACKSTSASSRASPQPQASEIPSNQSNTYMDESAIYDDGNASGWEDAIEESDKSSVDDVVAFKRVPSKMNHASETSLLSLMFAKQEKRNKVLTGYASYPTRTIPQRAKALQDHSNMNVVSPPRDSDNGLETRRGLRPKISNPIIEIPRHGARPITTNSPAALSPGTTRRNLLAEELTESLRRQLLWERQQKTSTANAVFKRRHTSLDVANLKQYPERAYMEKEGNRSYSISYDQYSSRDCYHTHGW
ncbi:hypothetical protein F4821DRAFT_247153 [Hypoxylon rubiginosum]|uniref:Uncharacterized protein n=1 Tax=Hypoxylon rubiginosum TaxID=110542 RepID=A0ACC0CQ48_9PEZI|nr:hypothetical protein F4821DRAFT_247153 [Hypoxylon rubiginosum]